MALITKNIKDVASYQQWEPADITAGDILGVYESLGNKAPRKVTVESLGGSTQIRFNVVKQVFKKYGGLHEPWVGVGAGATRDSAVLVGEIEEVTPLIIIESGTVQVWDISEVCVKDIKVVVKPSGLKITVA